MVPVNGGAGPRSWAVALGVPEGCGDCASPGKEQSSRTPSKRKWGARQGRLSLLETNRQRVRPEDFCQEPFLDKFTWSLSLLYVLTLPPDNALTGQRCPKFPHVCFWMIAASYRLDEREIPEGFLATPLARRARNDGAPEKGAKNPPAQKHKTAAVTRQGAGSARRATPRRSTAHRSGSRCVPPFQGFLRLCICGSFPSKSFHPR